ncbi:MAG: ferredoxin [Thermodesulfobacteriota bacterium]|nr:ferredoxin [Thermodesulfobacteriota bacterium]
MMTMPKRLYIDPKECKACGACEEICPEVFRVDEDLGYARILDLETYPEDKINEAIITCPGRCIDWDESKDNEYFCQKYQEPIKTKPPACPHPLDYCQFRSSCPVHFLEKEKGS